MFTTILSLLATTAFLTLPAVMIWGWVRWFRKHKPARILPILSLVGFTLATLSELLAVSTVLYTRISGGFGYYDPTLMKIYALGMLLSVAGMNAAMIGVWRPGSIRWHGLICSFGTLLYWLVQAANE